MCIVSSLSQDSKQDLLLVSPKRCSPYLGEANLVCCNSQISLLSNFESPTSKKGTTKLDPMLVLVTKKELLVTPSYYLIQSISDTLRQVI